MLGRPATGLPRYYMDCGWYRHPHFAGLPVESLFCFEAIIGYSTEYATNGIVPSHPEDLSIVLGVRASVVRKAIPPLVDRAALIHDGATLTVRSWSDHNPLREEVSTFSDSQRVRSAYGNHVRHHVKKGVTNLDCVHCTADAQGESPGSGQGASLDAPLATSPGEPSLGTLASGSHGMGWDGKEEPPTPASGGSPASHHGQHPSCRACGTNPRARAAPGPPQVPDAGDVIAAHRVPDDEVAPPPVELTRTNRHSNGRPETST